MLSVGNARVWSTTVPDPTESDVIRKQICHATSLMFETERPVDACLRHHEQQGQDIFSCATMSFVSTSHRMTRCDINVCIFAIHRMNFIHARPANRILQPLFKVYPSARRSFLTRQRDLVPRFTPTRPRLTFPIRTTPITLSIKSFAMSTQADHDARDKKAQKEIKEKCFVVGA